MRANDERATTMKPRKQPKLSKTQRAILLRLKRSTALFEKYQQAGRDLAKAQSAFEKAREALKQIDPIHAETLAEADQEAAEVLRNLKMLQRTPPQTAPQEPVAPVESPAAWADALASHPSETT